VTGLLEQLRAPGNDLGSGAAAAAVAAIAAAVLQEVARESAPAWGDAGGAAAQAEALAARLATLGDRNSTAYRRVRAALAGDLPGDGQVLRDFTLAQLLEESAHVPSRIAAAAADVAELAELLAVNGIDARRPDARAAAMLAAAAADAAAELVGINLAERSDGPLATSARASVRRARGVLERTGTAGGR